MTSSATFGTIIQAVTVELFQAHGAAVAPVRDSGRRGGEEVEGVSSIVVFNGLGEPASLMLVVPYDLINKIQQRTEHQYVADCSRELVNQLMGRLKVRLLQFDIALQPGIPSPQNSKLAARTLEKRDHTRVYRFRSLKGDVAVVLEGNVDALELKYRGTVEVASEGEVIVF